MVDEKLLIETMQWKMREADTSDWNRCLDEVERFIREFPQKDNAEIVRCKDCKHATFYNCKNDACYKRIICEYEIGTDDENFYCAYGEARTPKERDGR